jgi:hypothetical protein
MIFLMSYHIFRHICKFYRHSIWARSRNAIIFNLLSDSFSKWHSIKCFILIIKIVITWSWYDPPRCQIYFLFRSCPYCIWWSSFPFLCRPILYCIISLGPWSLIRLILLITATQCKSATLNCPWVDLIFAWTWLLLSFW